MKIGKVTANDKDEGTVTITVTVKVFNQTYTAECVVMVIDDVEISGYVIDISGIQGGNSEAINEIELYNSEDNLLSVHYLDGARGDGVFSNFSIEAYDSRTEELPAYWNQGANLWGKENLFDGAQHYDEETTTTFNSWGSSSEECWARLFIYNLSEDVNKIKIYSGGMQMHGGRYPVELSVYKVTGYRTQIVNENLKTKDNDSKMTLWETQQVSTDNTVIAENIFVKP